jgi:hypothetical protein
MWCPQVRFAACAQVSGPKLARARACGGRPPSVTVSQHGHAFACASHVLGDLRRRRRGDVSDLMTALRRHRLAGQARPAPAAHRRRAPDPLIRVIGKLHRRPRLARLLAGPPPAPLPQRPVPALLLIRAVRRRRPRRHRRIPAHPALEVFHPGSQPLVPRGQLADQPVRLSQPRRRLSQQGEVVHREAILPQGADDLPDTLTWNWLTAALLRSLPGG